MLTPVLKFTDIKKDPNSLLGLDHAYICKRGDVVAHVVSTERMNQLLIAEKMLERTKQDNEILKLSNKSLIDLSEMPF